MKIRIQIWNNEGKLVTDDEIEAQEASDTEIREMVSLIEGGCPASIAAAMIIAERDGRRN